MTATLPARKIYWIEMLPGLSVFDMACGISDRSSLHLISGESPTRCLAFLASHYRNLSGANLPCEGLGRDLR